MRYLVGVSVPKGNGHRDRQEVEVEADSEADATWAVWELLAGMGVETWVEPIGDGEDEPIRGRLAP